MRFSSLSCVLHVNATIQTHQLLFRETDAFLESRSLNEN
jgi:hypothetical protein